MARVPNRNSPGENSWAADVAISALGFLASDPERLDRFLAISGLGPSNLRSAAADPGFLVGVLDYVNSDERLLIAFAADQGARPEDMIKAREALGGRPPIDT